MGHFFEFPFHFFSNALLNFFLLSFDLFLNLVKFIQLLLSEPFGLFNHLFVLGFCVTARVELSYFCFEFLDSLFYETGDIFGFGWEREETELILL